MSFDEKHDVKRTPYCRMWLLLQPKDDRDPISERRKKGAKEATATVWHPDDVNVIAVYVARGLPFRNSEQDRYVWVWIDRSLEFIVL